MAEDSVAQKLRVRIGEYVRRPDVTGEIHDVQKIRHFIDVVEPTLCHIWFLTEIGRLMKSEAARIKSDAVHAEAREHPQMRLLGPGFLECFPSGLAQRVMVRGSRKRLGLLTVSQLRQAAAGVRAKGAKAGAAVRERYEKRAVELEAAANQIAPYAEVHRRLNLEGWAELQEAGVKPHPKEKETVRA